MIITKTASGRNYQNDSKTFCVELHVLEDDSYLVIKQKDEDTSSRVFKDKTNAIRYITYLINGE